MKRKMLVVILVLVGLLLGGTVQAGPGVNLGTYSTYEGHFNTKFWQEKFFGGYPPAGQPGNVIMAVGQGFVLQNAVLAEGDKPVWAAIEGNFVCYGGGCPELPESLIIPPNTAYVVETIYENGRLTLNSSLKKWLTKGSLQHKDVTATNWSFHDTNWNLLGFIMKMNGEFDNSPNTYDITATFTIAPDESNYKIFVDEDGITVQKGYGFDAIIEIMPLPE